MNAVGHPTYRPLLILWSIVKERLTVRSVVNPAASTTTATTDIPPFYAEYGGNGNNQFVSGYFVTENLAVGGATIKGLDMAIVTAGQGPVAGGGIMGLSYDGLEATATNASEHSVYPTIVDTMYRQGIISSHAYSLYLDDLSMSSL